MDEMECWYICKELTCVRSGLSFSTIALASSPVWELLLR